MTAELHPLSSAPITATPIAPRWIALGLFFLTVALRLPFASQTLNHWDSVNHALALTSFDVPHHRPQPPGYILYIGLARLVNLVIPDAQTALVTVSILASGLAVALLFLLGARLASRELGLIAALLLMTCPPFWFDSEVALPYVVEGCASVALALLLYKLRMGETQIAPLTAVVFAIAIGMRQQLALFFVPLVLYAYWNQSRRVRLESLAWFAGVCLVWFLPLVISAGGIAAYSNAVRGLNSAFASEYVLFGTGGLPALLRNFSRMGAYTLYALNFAVIPLIFGGIYLVRGPRSRARMEGARQGGEGEEAAGRNGVRSLLVLWIAPSVLFYLLFHMGSPGLVYVFLPALYIVAAFGVLAMTRRNVRARVVVVLALCAANIYIFVGMPADLYLGRGVRVLNYSALVEHDRSLLARVQAIRANFDPATTLILADDWRFAEYYLANYLVLHVPGDATQRLILMKNMEEEYLRANQLDVSQVEMLVWFDESALEKFDGAANECMELEGGGCMPVVHLGQRGGVKVLPDRLEVKP
jgi:hypothetical protein